ncbi:RNA 2',3'-cyclic phosphodiesterase [Nanoarchaeota archaeon]
MRCFISIDLPKELQLELARVQKEIEDIDVKMNLVDTDKIHLTMKFLGELNDLQVENVVKVLKELRFNKFKAKLERIGVFPNASFIRVVWLGVKPREEFVKIHDKIDHELHQIRFKKDQIFENHATLSRVKWLKDKTKYFEKLHKIEVKPLEFTVDKIHLKKSTLTESGPIYEDLFVLELD